MDEVKMTRGEAGYTLVETLVAMALFLGVLIPTLGALAGFFSHAPERTTDAMLIARNEALAMAGGIVGENEVSKGKGFFIQRHIQQVGALLEITFTVVDSSIGGKIVATLHETILSYPE